MSGKKYIRRHLNGNWKVCRDQYRLSPPNFRLLCDKLLEHGFESKGNLIVEEHVGMLLEMLAHGATMRKLAENFQHSEQTVHASVKNTMRYLLRLRHDYMKVPGADAPIHPKLREGTAFHPFKDALGAIDDTHIRAFPDKEFPNKERWRNIKGTMTQNVMAAVDFDGKFVLVVAGWEGSAHDSFVLRNTVEQGFKVPEGRYYLVDSGYGCTHQFLSPYRGRIYHLGKFQNRRRDNRYENAEELFNHRHAQLRNIVEKSFGILKGRWQILRDMHRYKYDFQTDIVIACCVLHNFLIEHRDLQDDCDEADSFINEDSDTDDEQSSSSGVNNTARGSRRTDAQRGADLRDKIKDMLWNAR